MNMNNMEGPLKCILCSTYGLPFGAIPRPRRGSPKGGRGNPFSRPNPGPGKGPGNPGIPKGAPGKPGPLGAPGGAPGAPAAPDVGVVGGLGVVGFSLPDSFDFLPEDGAGVDDADDLPLRGLIGSFFAFKSPFSCFGGVLLSPLVNVSAPLLGYKRN